MFASVMITLLLDAIVQRKGDFIVEPNFLRNPHLFNAENIEQKVDTIEKAYQEGKKYGLVPDSDEGHNPYQKDTEEGMAWLQGYKEAFFNADPHAEKE